MYLHAKKYIYIYKKKNAKKYQNILSGLKVKAIFTNKLRTDMGHILSDDFSAVYNNKELSHSYT